jgi:hypothetical protein
VLTANSAAIGATRMLRFERSLGLGRSKERESTGSREMTLKRAH